MALDSLHSGVRTSADAPRGRIDLPALGQIASGLARTAYLWEGRLTHHPTVRTGLRLIATDDYDVWLLRWPPGSNVEPHDHGDSVGAFSVVSGELTELRWTHDLPLVRAVGPGQTVTIDKGVVHDVIGGPAAAVSVHAYSPPLSSMYFYDESGRRVLDRQDVPAGHSMVETSQLLHPAGGR